MIYDCIKFKQKKMFNFKKITKGESVAGRDRLLKKPDLLPILKIGRNKLYDIIKSGDFIQPIKLPGVKLDLYSYNELQQWILTQRQKRNEK